MLKKITTFFAVMLFAISAHAARFNAGEDYQILDVPKTQTPTVAEYFSFYCPYCYRSQGLMTYLEENVKEGTPINKNHVSFMGGNMGKALSRAHATAIMLGLEKKMAGEIFNRIHNTKTPPKNEVELRQIFIDAGVDGKKYDSTINSFAANSMANRFDKSFQATGLGGVPAVVINGKYHVTPKTIKTEQEYVELVNFLLTQ
jgi:thiol:disulfide interchange protein DsbA